MTITLKESEHLEPLGYSGETGRGLCTPNDENSVYLCAGELKYLLYILYSFQHYPT